MQLTGVARQGNCQRKAFEAFGTIGRSGGPFLFASLAARMVLRVDVSRLQCVHGVSLTVVRQEKDEAVTGTGTWRDSIPHHHPGAFSTFATHALFSKRNRETKHAFRRIFSLRRAELLPLTGLIAARLHKYTRPGKSHS